MLLLSRFQSILIALVLIILIPLFISAQSKKNSPPGSTAAPVDEPAAETQDDETIKVETNLVTVPVIASDRNDLYVPDLQKEEFTLKDDGVVQQIAFFATTTAPFNVVLMIDTSASTQQKLTQLQRAAVNFTEQLQDQDRLKVISFDDTIRELGNFTNDRAELQRQINQTRPGKGTKLYDAVTMAINSLLPVKGRKAIVLFTDGVDYHSDRSTYDNNRRAIQESGIIVYTIRYETRAETERLVRAQAEGQRGMGGGGGVDLASILGGNSAPARGTTAPTFPGGDSSQIPTNVPAPTMRIPMPQLPSRRGTPREQGPDPNSPFPDTTGGRMPRFPENRNDPGTISQGPRPQDDGISGMLDVLYKTADDYLQEMATESGGQMVRADTLMDLPGAFATIANELRTQYSIGYYPTNHTKDGKYHKLKVNTTRKDVVIRSRPGYRAPSGKTPGRFSRASQTSPEN